MNLRLCPRFASLLAVAALLLSACVGQLAAPSAPPAAPMAVNTVSAAEWQTIILDAFRKQAAQSWRYDSVTRPEGGEEASTTIEFVPPDRYRIHSLPGHDLVVVGPRVYAQDGEQWALTDIPGESLNGKGSFQLLEKTIRDVQCSSPELLDGKTTHACRYKSTTTIGGSDLVNETQLWIEAETGLPHKMIIDGYITQMENDTGKMTPVKATSTLVYTFDPAIQIELPEAVKEAE